MMRGGLRWRWRRDLTTVLVAVGIAGILAVPAAASALPEADDAPLRPPTGSYFGTTIDWSSDSAAAEAERLGRPPALLEHVTRFPVTALERTYLE
jgi:hypothetical protein